MNFKITQHNLNLNLNFNFNHWLKLCRLDKPIGIYLVLWPALQAFWVTCLLQPEASCSGLILSLIIVGAVIMRSAGCVINDWWDQSFDGKVQRTETRVLAHALGEAKTNAWVIAGFMGLSGLAWWVTHYIAEISNWILFQTMGWIILYPATKRFFACPQFILGITFGQAIWIVFALQQVPNGFLSILLFGLTVIWALMYDTYYALCDLQDDLKLNLYSSARLFGKYVWGCLSVLQGMYVLGFLYLGYYLNLGKIYYFGVLFAGMIGINLQVKLYRANNDSEVCFLCFKRSHWQGFLIMVSLGLAFFLNDFL